MERKNRDSILTGVLDFETDPFLHGRVPFPFACGIYFGESDSYNLLYGENIIEKTYAAIKKLPRCILYAHNGGKFDFFYLVEFANEGKCLVRNGRIFEMQIGNVLLRDSWPLMPFALEEYRKTKIDYSIFEEDRRNSVQNKLRIQNYLYDDCKNLYDLIKGFKSIVGPKDTIGAAAFYQMRKLGIEIESLNEAHDDIFRPYFFGGRVEAFQRGIHNGKFQYLDINSAYPCAMLSNHAHGVDYVRAKRLPNASVLGNCFVTVDASSEGAFPLRNDDGSLDFPRDRHIYSVTGWEIIAGLETRTIKIHKVLECLKPTRFVNFSAYVEMFYGLRQEAKRAGDKIATLAYKYLLNSGYGKFAQNPRDFREYRLNVFGEYPDDDACNEWEWETDYGNISLWSRPNFEGTGFYDVATGASITGFQRAVLWKGICNSSGVLYCDTDAILCKKSNVKTGINLGQWKQEGIASECCIAGKKLYALRADTACFDGSKTKIASKGARLSYAQIKSLCRGETVTWENPAPTFSATIGATFVKRRIQSTGEDDEYK